MNELIKLLFSNIYVVIIIIGVIMTIIKKTKNGASSNRMPSFGGKPEPQSPANQHQQTSQRLPVRPRPVSDQLLNNAASKHSEYEEDDFLTHLNEDQRTVQRKQAVPKPAASDNRTEVKREAAFRMPQGEDLRKAVILAEVLGPPRAKKAFRK
jgi:hypothetical protein